MQKGSGTQDQMCFCGNQVPKHFLWSFSSASLCFTSEDMWKYGWLGFVTWDLLEHQLLEGAQCLSLLKDCVFKNQTPTEQKNILGKSLLFHSSQKLRATAWMALKFAINKMRHNELTPMLWLNPTNILCTEPQSLSCSEDPSYLGVFDPSWHYTQKKSGHLYFSMV